MMFDESICVPFLGNMMAHLIDLLPKLIYAPL